MDDRSLQQGSSPTESPTPLRDFLRRRLAGGPLTADATVAAVAPLIRQVLDAHEDGRVAPLEGLDRLWVDRAYFWFQDADRLPPRLAYGELRRLEKPWSRAFDVFAEVRQVDDVATGEVEEQDLRVGRPGDEVVRPVYLPGYRCWEHRIGHHDALTDVFSLGLILASVACGSDFDDRRDLEDFVRCRDNLFELAPSLHPVLAQAIVRMTELDRHRRAQDLGALLRRLERYREVDVEVEFDVGRIPGFQERDRSGKRRAVLAHLEERLFEISRRNPLLYFKPRTNTLNLTLASVPLYFDPQAIEPESLLTWQPWLREKLAKGEKLVLDNRLRFEEATYLAPTLDKIRLEAGRDARELGFANLRLVAAFLRWHDLKEAPEQRIHSPLVLLPVRLRKKRGVKDRFVLEPLATSAEVNPVLRHQLLRLYDIRLPESIDLETTDLEPFHAFLREQIQASEPGVELRWIDRPRVKLIHGQAWRRMNQYLSRQRRSGRLRSYRDVDYSYRRHHLQPLGLRLFQTRIRPAPVHLELLVGQAGPRRRTWAAPAAGTAGETDSGRTRERKLAAFQEGGEANRYAWDFDLCSLTLGNFRYRKMSLVRDYDALIEEDRTHEVFDSIFSVAPRAALEYAEPLPLKQRFPVLPCDPTQASAVDVARRGASYIIQGPPGTGKSQTIANLIADFVAHGRRVLFVCQKRAAIDVVFLRLKTLGLDELCCLVHDAQADKKAVIHDLRDTYQSFLKSAPPADAAPPERRRCLAHLERALGPLRRFDDAMRSADDRALPAWQLLARLVELRDAVPDLAPADREALPRYDRWLEHRDRLQRLDERIRDVRADGVFSRHALAVLAPGLADRRRPYTAVAEGLERAAALLEGIRGALAELPVGADAWPDLGRLRELLGYARQVEPFASRGLLPLAEPSSDFSRTFETDCRKHRRRQEVFDEQVRINRHWNHKLSLTEIEIALEQAEDLGRRWLPFTRPGWWRLRGVLGRSYDWSAVAVRPTWVSVLRDLRDEYLAASQLRELEEDLEATYGWQPFAELGGEVAKLREASAAWPGPALELHRGVLEAPDRRAAQRRLAELPRLEQDADAFEDALAEVFADPGSLDLRRLEEVAGEVDAALDDLDDVLPCLAELAPLDAALAAAVRERPWTLAQVEAAVADATLEDVYRASRSVRRFTAKTREQYLGRLAEHVDSFYRANVVHVREKVREQFTERADLAQVPASALSREKVLLKNRYGKGRRELEHEFGKQMRYKSIRDLWSGPAGTVLRDLKPVWLMSPLSISDTLPLVDEHFDVVIFDEASQIPVEEAVPALFRARQAIVVGDEMQLPPTSFFAARSPDDELLVVEDEGALVEYDLSSNSFLNQSAKSLPSTFLGWHYRSRSEALISFSNAAFYNGRLLTVPEEELPRGAEPIRVTDPVADGARGVEALLERSVSFHLLENGCYEKRRNAAEAEYVARLVATLLERRTGLSLGVVAFSEAQQDEIEVALERLARRDKGLRRLLDEEYEREDDGEFAGLLVKNLENIQGDERDVVILSVCYGPAPDGRVRMNFGPINQGGGEKRLNVAFSRSKHHMVVVSSIDHRRITNVYNDGANSLRNYLRYAEAVSTGDLETVERLLDELAVARQPARRRGPPASNPVVDELAAALEESGFRVDRRVGRSVFRCDLAVCRPGDRTYRLGILVDTAEHYRQTDVLERDLMKPRLLEAFGWRVFPVLTKDWYHERGRVLERLLEAADGIPPGGVLPKTV